MLCQVDIAVIVFGANQKLYEFSSTDTNQLIQRYQKSIPYEKKTPEDYNGKKRGHRPTGSVTSVKSEPTDEDDEEEDDGEPNNVTQNATPQMAQNSTPQMAQSVTPQQMPQQQQQQQQAPLHPSMQHHPQHLPHHPDQQQQQQQRYYDYMSMGQMGHHPHQQQIMQQQLQQQQQQQQMLQQQQQQHQQQLHKSQYTPISQEMSSLAGHLLDIRESRYSRERGNSEVGPPGPPGAGVAGAGSGYIPGSEGSSRASSRHNSVARPKLKVQIPGEKRGSNAGAAGAGSRPASGEGTPVDAKEENTSHSLLLPPPSPSSYINNSGVGPGNPFAKPTLLNGEQTPLSAALPSRYLNDLLPSPSNFYGTEWNFNPGSAGGSSFSAGGSLIPTSASKDKKRVDSEDNKPGTKKQRLS